MIINYRNKMDLSYVLQTILKIIISTSAILILCTFEFPTIHGAALMGEGNGKVRNLTNVSAPYYDYEFTDSQELEEEFEPETSQHSRSESEDIPDPSPLVLPGYNLPDNIFNEGKPFYGEKDPSTGNIEFKQKLSTTKSEEDLYDYVDDEPNPKSNIDRKDTNFGSHRPNDVNQLIPNFHDFLNLPVKYNSAKYVYPLISSSYASTKYQGSLNKLHNHKDYPSKSTTKKPYANPTYRSTEKYFKVTYSTTTPTTTTTQKTTTTTTKPTETTKVVNLLDTGMGVDFSGDFEDYYDTTMETTSKKTISTTPVSTTTTTTTTTKKILSLFEQLFGEFDETTKIYSQQPQKVPAPTEPYPNYDYEDTDDNIAVESRPEEDFNVETITTVKPIDMTTDYTEETTSKVTSLPLGDNHLTTTDYEPFKNREPIIVATQNLREKLNGEKVAPNRNNVHIPHGQDTVSLVLGNRQNLDGGYYGTAVKERPYDANPFRPYYGDGTTNENDKEITLKGSISFPSESEASLAIGVPVGTNKQTPGQVLDEKLDPDADSEKRKNKIVFPFDNRDLVPPPPPPAPARESITTGNNREVLQLNSSPLLHQLPSDLTPPREQEASKRPYNGRPPWDPRPGHFHSGNPEYNRPPRPHSDTAYKRIDNLPNILPQFRPNTSKYPQNYHDKKLNRQPLLDRPSNRPISFFEKLQPPPPPPPNFLAHKNIPASRNKNTPPIRANLEENLGKHSEDGVVSEDQPGMYQTPPQVKLANRRADSDVTEIETLQMIQAKTAEKRNKDVLSRKSIINGVKSDFDDNTEKTIYKVYPVNSSPVKMDVIDDNNKKESVVIGTVSERPLPPSKINQDFEIIFDPKDRNDDPILKPHKPAIFPIKSDFPYPLERPGFESNLNLIPVPETPTKIDIDLDDRDYFSNNQWNTIDVYEPKIVNGQKITVTLKTHTDKPIAVAYTPTEPNPVTNKYSMPNYGSPVIPEIRPSETNKVYTVSAIMHTNHQNGVVNNPINRMDVISNHKTDVDLPEYPKFEFEAPFQASVKIDNTMSDAQGWSIVRSKNFTSTEAAEETTLPYATTSEFDIENFKPQLEGGFKPILNFPEDEKKFIETKVNDRDE
ncbi:uncharacterized protein LOC130895413 isoform X2 [Diorhabda carinulata]|uniref:uncharacterized protein LOC130895413 isoform X2 n=1 Tax=Diorhabda carinulata TaxID=1163345 RepID=UPI0025A13A1C|nr:uncharacterized protein LOC130895413 isoform X2 [Diorhabda carinulata]